MAIYNTSAIEILDNFMFDDPTHLFTRPPHIVKFRGIFSFSFRATSVMILFTNVSLLININSVEWRYSGSTPLLCF